MEPAPTNHGTNPDSLLKHKGWLQVFLECMPDPIVVTDLESTIIALNPQRLDLCGNISPDEVIGRNILEFIAPEDRQRVADHARHALETGKADPIEYNMLRVDGSYTPVELTSSLITDRRKVPQGFTRVLRDITERKRGQEAMLRLAAIVESSDNAIYSNTLDGIITTWNAGAERIFGYSPREILGRSASILTPPERPDEIAQILQKIKRGEQIERFETISVTKNYRQIEVALTISPMIDYQGNIIGASTIGNDITSHKQTERARARLLAELQDALAQVKHLRGLLPICFACKKIRDDAGYWKQIETYIAQRTEVKFTHGICPGCAKKLYPEAYHQMFPEIAEQI